MDIPVTYIHLCIMFVVSLTNSSIIIDINKKKELQAAKLKNEGHSAVTMHLYIA